MYSNMLTAVFLPAMQYPHDTSTLSPADHPDYRVVVFLEMQGKNPPFVDLASCQGSSISAVQCSAVLDNVTGAD